MSISSEINRITNAKEDIITAIKNRGGTVEEGTKIDGLADAIMGMPDSVKINGSKSIRTNNSGEKIAAGSMINIMDSASADIGEIKSDLTHSFDEYTMMLTLTDIIPYNVIVSLYQYNTTDYGFLIEWCNIMNEYDTIKKFLTPVLFKLSSTSAVNSTKQSIHPAVLGPNRFVLGIFNSYSAEGVAMTENQIRIMVFDFEFPYKSYGVENAKMSIIDQVFTFDKNAVTAVWTNYHTNSSQNNFMDRYLSMITSLDESTFMIPIKYTTNTDKRIGLVFFKTDNGAIRVVKS